MSDVTLSLGEPADEADWRALVEQGLKGAPWARLVGKTGDGVPIQPLYREADFHTAADQSGFPGAAPFVRGAALEAGWTIRQAFDHPDPEETNRDILADLAGGVGGIELVIGDGGINIASAAALDVALANVILEAAPVSLDVRGGGDGPARWLREKLRGVAPRGTAFNLDPISHGGELDAAAAFAAEVSAELANATIFRIDARRVHEAGSTEAQEIAAALSSGIAYLRALEGKLAIDQAAATLSFAVSVGPDVLIETAKLRALRLCWARVLEASGASPAARAARLHAFTSRRMMTRYDAWTNILRVSTAAFAASIGGAEAITTYPFTDALGLPTPFARRVARNTQNVLMEECRLGHVADPAGGAWFVEKMTRELAAGAWDVMQLIEARGGIVKALSDGLLGDLVAGARAARQRLIATRRETITGVTDFPLLGAKPIQTAGPRAPAPNDGLLQAIRWVQPFEALRDRAEQAGAPSVFFANMATLAEFGPRAQWTRNLFASGGVHDIGAEEAHATMEALIDAFRAARARVAVITGADAYYTEHAVNAAQRLKAAGAHWVVIAGKPGESETALRAAGVDQFVHAGQDALKELETLHAALGIAR